MTFLESTTDLPDPVSSDPLASSSGKAQTAFVKDVTDAVEDIRGALAGPAFRSVKAFAPVPLTVLDTADALTNWVGVGITPVLDTAIKSTGTASVKLGMRTDTLTCKGYVNIVGAPSTVGKIRLVFDYRHDDVDKFKPADCFEFVMSSAINLGGTVVSYPIPYSSTLGFLTLTLPLTGLTTLGSFGIRHKSDPLTVLGKSTTVDQWLDNVRWEATELDAAIDSAKAVIVPADYVATGHQNPLAIPSSKTVIDLRPRSARITFLNGVRHTRDFALPEDESVDCRPMLIWIIGQCQPGDILDIAPGKYIYNGGGDIAGLEGVWIRCNGAKFYRTEQNSTSQGTTVDGIVFPPQGNAFNIRSSHRLRISDGHVFGFRTDTTVATPLAWSSVTAYTPGMIVTSAGVLYTCAIANTNSIPPNANWVLSPAKGLLSVASNLLPEQASGFDDSSSALAPAHNWTGLPNTGIGVIRAYATSPNGSSLKLNAAVQAWSAATAYIAGAVVTRLNVMYTCILANTNQAPPNATYWTVTAGLTIGVTQPITPTTIPMDVEGSTSYVVAAKFLPHNQPATYMPATARTCEIKVLWYTAAGAPTGSPSTITGVETDMNTWALVSGTVTSPSTAQKASLELHVLNVPGALLAGEAHDVDSITFTRATARVLPTLGTTLQLTNPGDEARLAIARMYGRDKDYQYRCDFTLAASASVTGDCELVLRDEDTGELIAKRPLTLPATGTPGTPVVYSLVFSRNTYTSQETALYQLMRFSVRKVKADANTITISAVTEFNKMSNDRGDAANGFSILDTDPDSSAITIENFLVEGVGGDAVVWTASAHRCRAINVVSRCNGRQGFTMSGGSENTYEDCTVYGSGRSGLDMEPPQRYMDISRPRILNFRCFRASNSAIAMGNWELTEHGIFDGIFVWGSGNSEVIGGRQCAWNNLVSEHPLHTSVTPDWTANGVGSVFQNVVCEYGFKLDGSTKTFVDSSGNYVSIVSANNKVGLVTVNTPGGYGVQVFGDNYITPSRSTGTVAAGAGLNSFTVTIAARTNTTYGVFVELGWHATYIVTARTTTSFTIATSVPVPVGGSSFNWETSGA